MESFICKWFVISTLSDNEGRLKLMWYICVSWFMWVLCVLWQLVAIIKSWRNSGHFPLFSCISFYLQTCYKKPTLLKSNISIAFTYNVHKCKLSTRWVTMRAADVVNEIWFKLIITPRGGKTKKFYLCDKMFHQCFQILLQIFSFPTLWMFFFRHAEPIKNKM